MNNRVKITVNNQEIWNSIEEPDEQNEELLNEVENWLKENLLYQKTINRSHTSYRLKHIVEKMIGKYVSNVDIKRVMARMGIKGQLANPSGINYWYPINNHFFWHFQNLIGLKTYLPHLAKRRANMYNKLKEGEKTEH